MPIFFEEFFVTGVFAFILSFVRIGTAVMIMPGLGDSFVPQRIRLHVALGFSFVLFPLIVDKIPDPIPTTMALITLIVIEFVIGVFIGSIARIFMAALDVAGMVISFSSSLSNAQLFNPSLASQGSLMGAFLSVTGMLVIFAANFHHLLIMGVLGSYDFFPVGGVPDAGSMAELVARALSSSFLIGVQIGAPFVVMTLLIYMGMGVLSRLMPQIQVFLLALPLQVLLSLIMLSLVLSAGFMYWLSKFEEAMVFFLGG